MATTASKTGKSTKANAKAEVKQVILDFCKAFAARNVDLMMGFYADEAIVFDVKPPFQTRGKLAWRHTWEACMPYFPDTFEVVQRDLVIHAGEDVAFAHWLFRIVTADPNHDAAQTWMRGTTGFRKQNGKWKIVHEHGSLPFNPHNMQAIFTLDV